MRCSSPAARTSPGIVIVLVDIVGSLRPKSSWFSVRPVNAKSRTRMRPATEM
jgi:hypothetical protein